MPEITETLQSNMSASSSSATNKNVKGYGLLASDKKMHFESDSDNFKSWQTRMRLRLRKMKLADVFDQEEPYPIKNLEV